MKNKPSAAFVDRMKEAVEHIQIAGDLFAQGPLDYYLKKLVEHSDALLNTYAPIKTGERARIVSDVPCKDGWKGSEKHLCAGVVGDVTDVEFSKGGFLITFVPDKQFYKNRDGKYVVKSRNHSYCLQARFLEPMPNDEN